MSSSTSRFDGYSASNSDGQSASDGAEHSMDAMDAGFGIGLPDEVSDLLLELTGGGGYDSALICTDGGLLLACTGDLMTSEELAGVVGLLEDVVMRSERDLGMSRVDEVSLLEPGRGRLIIRPIVVEPTRFHLVVRVPARVSWRRNTNRVVRALGPLLARVA